MLRKLGWMFLVVAGVACAQRKPVESVTIVMPLYHQLFSFSQPTAFDLNVKPQQNASFFLRETPLRGETVEHWTQMITLNAYQGGVAKGLTAKGMTDRIAGKFQKACPETFAYKNIGGEIVNGVPNYAIGVSCGTVADAGGQPGAMHSETTLVVAVQGDQDLYTLQWAERAADSAKPLVIDEAALIKKFRALCPIRVCAITGEKAPYPSCVGK